MTNPRRLISRRKALTLTAAAPLPFLVACSDGGGTPAPTTPAPAHGGAATTPTGTSPAGAPSPTGQAQAPLSPTPRCTDGDDEPTLSQTEGPYYTPNTPERTSLIEPGMTGTRLTLTGLVLSTGCAPVAKALIDFWQCNDVGEYDNAGFHLRGHQFSAPDGSYTLETVYPGLYPGRTRHIHVKVQAPNRPVLTTQLYFPDEPRNASDGIYRPELLVDLLDASPAKRAAFDFVLDLG
jgi:protocatechuate 3,4-dioxygenase beta subunit